MELCSDGHEEVCYAGKTCPACEAIEERDAAANERESKMLEITALENRIDELEEGRRE